MGPAKKYCTFFGVGLGERALMSSTGQYQALVVGSGGWAGCRALCPGGGTGQNQPGGGLIMECTLYTAL